MTSHQSSWLKQKNKQHKTSHRTKSQLNKLSHGRILTRKRKASTNSHKTFKTTLTTTSNLSKLSRNIHSKNIRKNKKVKLESKYLKSGLSTSKRNSKGAPKQVTIIPLAETPDFKEISDILSLPHVSEGSTQLTQDGKFLIHIPHSNIFSLLDAAKCSDIVLLLTSTNIKESNFEKILENSISSRGRTLLTLLKAQGLPTIIGSVLGLTINKKYQQKLKKEFQRFYEEEFGKEVKFTQLNQLERVLGEVKIKEVSWRQGRGWLWSEDVRVEERKVVVEGWWRGMPLDVHQVVHLTGFGSMNIERVENLNSDEVVVADQTKKREIVEEVKDEDVDMFAQEQTWPTEEELGKKEGYGKDWIPSDDESWLGEIEEKDEDLKLAVEEEEKDELEFPDEKEVKFGELGKERFVKYRGLESGGKGYWDPKENLPREYLKLFQLEDVTGIEKHTLKENENLQKWHLTEASKERTLKFSSSLNGIETSFILPGNRIRLTLSGDNLVVQKLVAHKGSVSIFSLNNHETKLTTLTARVRKNTDRPVKSKDVLMVQCGFWRREIRPVFHQQKPKDMNAKFLKFLPEDFTDSTFFGPITFGTAIPVLFFRDEEVVANGSLTDMNPERVILKRIILTGYPLRIKKNKAVVRYMFHDPVDVRWFRPVSLWTKLGAKGEIREPVGTHGLFKASFDRYIQSNDTICMSLFKRVYPKGVQEFKGMELS
eukprot:maker-scaffold_8-snap-gene-14.10-mRNA-1 protein AED:0.00 eAED:0.00 QI:29/1/1/1/1/1/2/25/710